ncbi:hypothetical protein LCGC14_2075440, partial [marine sediment metagenome]
NGKEVERSELNETNSAYYWYNDFSRMIGKKQNSLSPSLNDNSQTYAEVANSLRNPLKAWSDSSNDDKDGRGSFHYKSFTNAQQSAQIRADISEYLIVSPFDFGNNAQEEEGLWGVTSFQVTLSLQNDLSYMWSHSDVDSAITNFAVDVTLNSATLSSRYITPDESFVPRPMYDYNYQHYNVQKRDFGSAVAPNAQISICSNTLKMDVIPSYIYVFIKKKQANRTVLDSDSYFRIDNIKLKWANQPTLLSEYRTEDLFEMCVKNGYDGSFLDFTANTTRNFAGTTITEINGVGSVIRIRMGDDVGMMNQWMAPGLQYASDFQVEVLATNQNQSDTFEPTLYVVFQEDAVLSIGNNSAFLQLGVLSREDVINARKMEGINYQRFSDMQGGVNVKKIGRDILKIAKKGAPIAKKVLQVADLLGVPQADKALQIAKLLGIGVHEAGQLLGSQLIAGSRHKVFEPVCRRVRRKAPKKRKAPAKKRKAPAKKPGRPRKAKAGQLMSRDQLRQRLMEL